MEVAIPDIPTAATPNLATVSSSPPVFNMRSLHAEITHLKDELKSLRRSSHEQSPRRHSPSPTAEDPSVMCWYHQKFGSTTQKCCPHALIREMPRPATDGNQCPQPHT